MNNTLLMMIGRVMLAFYFMIPGVAKLTAVEPHLILMGQHDIPMAAPLLMVAGVAEVLAGLFLFAGSYVRFTALACALLILVINVMMHDFWNFEGVTAAHETQSFIKNLGIFAGLLILASVSPKRKISLKRFWIPDAKIETQTET